MNNIMVDLETLGTGSSAVILSIGAVVFNTDTDTLGTEFYCRVKPQSCVDAGMVVDADTVMWWMKQSDTARRALYEGDCMPLQGALHELQKFCGQGDVSELCVWGNGATFDNVILENAFRLTKMNKPWKFWNDRCFRTLRALRPDVADSIEFEGTPHNALDDAKHQARIALAIFKSLEK